MARAGRPTVQIILSAEERTTLERWARRHSSSQMLALRSKIVLACAAGGATEAFQIVAVNGIGDLIQRAFQPGAVRQIVGSGQQHVYGGIELLAGAFNVALLIEALARIHMHTGLSDQAIRLSLARRGG